MDLQDLLRRPNQYDLSDLFFRLGPRRFFAFMRYVYKKSKSIKECSAKAKRTFRCPECGNQHAKYEEGEAADEEQEWSDEFDDSEDEDADEFYDESDDTDEEFDDADLQADDLETKFFKYMFEQSMADDYTNFDGFWSRMHQNYAYDNETDQERQDRIRRELEEKRLAEERRRVEREEEKNRRLLEREKEKKEAEKRRQEKQKKKKLRMEQVQQELERKKLETRRDHQRLRSETFKHAREGDAAFVRDAVYKRGVAAEGLEVIYNDVVPSSVKHAHQDTLLHVAVRNDDYDLVEYLVGYGATPDENSSNGINSIHLTCLLNRPNILQYFCENYQEFLSNCTAKPFRSCKINQNPTPLHLAVERGHLRCVKLLVRYGVLVDQEVLNWSKKQLQESNVWEWMLNILKSQEKKKSGKRNSISEEKIIQKERDIEAWLARLSQQGSPVDQQKHVEELSPKSGKKKKKPQSDNDTSPVVQQSEPQPEPQPVEAPSPSENVQVDDYIRQQQLLLERLSQKHKAQKQQKEDEPKKSPGPKVNPEKPLVLSVPPLLPSPARQFSAESSRSSGSKSLSASPIPSPFLVQKPFAITPFTSAPSTFPQQSASSSWTASTIPQPERRIQSPKVYDQDLEIEALVDQIASASYREDLFGEQSFQAPPPPPGFDSTWTKKSKTQNAPGSFFSNNIW